MGLFETRDLDPVLVDVQDTYGSGARVFDVSKDFETLPPAMAEELGMVVDRFNPASYPSSWLPDDAPEALKRAAGPKFTIGVPGDGTVVWTRQTSPPVVLVKRRAVGTPEDFLRFLIAEAFVELSLEVYESFLPFFGERYRELSEAVLGPPETVYQVAAALFDAWVGLQSRRIFEDWEETRPELYEAWADAGNRLKGRLKALPGEVARNETTFAAATEFACSAIKHGLDLPPPFTALDTAAYREHGAEYAVRWAGRTYQALESD